MLQEIEGFASLTSVNRGERILMYVSARLDKEYRMRFFRMGWYGGSGGREVRTAVTRRGIAQVNATIPLTLDDYGFVDCAWEDPFELEVPTDWTSGYYLVQLTGLESGKQSYIIFVVRDDELETDFLMSSAVSTWHAYNNWGGRSSYPYNSYVSGCCADVLSFNRPYAPNRFVATDLGAGAGEFLGAYHDRMPAGWEYNMVRFLEREGYSVKYCTTIDTHQRPDIVSRSKAFLSVGHDEYWSAGTRATVETSLARGVSMGFFGANVCFYAVDYEPSNKTLQPDRLMRIRWTGEKEAWRNGPRYMLQEATLVGVQFSTEANGTLYFRDVNHWSLNNTGIRPGDTFPHLVGYEVDTIHDTTVPCVEHITQSPALGVDGVTPFVCDMVSYVAPSRATVYSVGTIQWSWGLDDFMINPNGRPLAADERIRAVTRNVLARFVAPHPPPFVVRDDNFDRPLDPEQWCRGPPIMEGWDISDRNATVVARDGTLQMGPGPRRALTGFDRQSFGVISRGEFDFRKQCAALRVVTVYPQAPIYFGLLRDRKRWFRFGLDNGLLVCSASEYWPSFQIQFDPETHSHLRFRYDPASNSVLFEASPQPVPGQMYQWKVLTPVPFHPLYDVRAMRVEISSAAWTTAYGLPVEYPGLMAFDDFRLESCSVNGTETLGPAFSNDTDRWLRDLRVPDTAMYVDQQLELQREREREEEAAKQRQQNGEGGAANSDESEAGRLVREQQDEQRRQQEETRLRQLQEEADREAGQLRVAMPPAIPAGVIVISPDEPLPPGSLAPAAAAADPGVAAVPGVVEEPKVAGAVPDPASDPPTPGNVDETPPALATTPGVGIGASVLPASESGPTLAKTRGGLQTAFQKLDAIRASPAGDESGVAAPVAPPAAAALEEVSVPIGDIASSPAASAAQQSNPTTPDVAAANNVVSETHGGSVPPPSSKALSVQTRDDWPTASKGPNGDVVAALRGAMQQSTPAQSQQSSQPQQPQSSQLVSQTDPAVANARGAVAARAVATVDEAGRATIPPVGTPAAPSVSEPVAPAGGVRPSEPATPGVSPGFPGLGASYPGFSAAPPAKRPSTPGLPPLPPLGQAPRQSAPPQVVALSMNGPHHEPPPAPGSPPPVAQPVQSGSNDSKPSTPEFRAQQARPASRQR